MKQDKYTILMYILMLACMSAMPLHAFVTGNEDVDAGLAALRVGRLEEAEAALRRAQFDAPTDPRIAYDLGIVAYHERRYDAAALEFESVASSTASSMGLAADALHNLGNARFQSGEYRQAIEAYQASLARREDPATQYNLEQAQKRLAEQQKNDGNQQEGGQKSSGNEQQGQQQPGQDGKSDENQPGKQDGKQKEGQGENPGGSEQKNAGQGGQQQQQSGKDSGNASDTRNQPTEASPSENASGTGEQKPSPRQSSTASDSARPDDAVASESSSWSEQDAKLRDVELDPKSQSAKDIPDASERARAMKNRKLNAYMIERLLRQMEDREKEIQRRYRRDPSDRDSDDPFDDPFFMDPDRMREFMEKRQGQRRKPEGDTPDW